MYILEIFKYGKVELHLRSKTFNICLSPQLYSEFLRGGIDHFNLFSFIFQILRKWANDTNKRYMPYFF